MLLNLTVPAILFKTKVLVWLRFMATLVFVCLGALEKKTNIKLTKASAGAIVKNVSEIKNKIEVEKPQIKSLQTINWNLNLKMYVKKKMSRMLLKFHCYK